MLKDEIKREEDLANANVAKAIAELKAKGCPVAKYDAQLKRPYMEYPDGRTEDISAFNNKKT